MNDLPPDTRRLKVILAYLEKQIADEETLLTYLRLQVHNVQAALARAETPDPPAPQRRRGRPVKGGSNLPAMTQAGTSVGFVVQRKRTPNGPEPAMVHLDDCTLIEGMRYSISAHDARASLTDPNVVPCAFCRPDTELGIDVA
ncbi:hypothetical protein EDD90_1942 [Streptomyces sp. Ag109_O5-1]|uniref:DUF6233 domain-containing protein n=1 Tax=Streptomyces sp. Ag109_O5-1 TaxID=1938851 RepID=UPI000F4DA08D|nr:DUF6233 domain-containing protein [Streptomyces sp. Ag109_O5-1]RPE38992.1 hypothetical protein EDD90_1942 [Streptomyces sp. Ag109_O5-1]